MPAQRITVLIDLPPGSRFHVATLSALHDAAAASGREVVIDVVRTDEIGELGDGVVVGPGSPYRDARAAEDVVTAAREAGIPLVGTWGGFQHVLVEHARNLCGITDAVHAEYGVPGTPIVTMLACSLADNQITVALSPGSTLRSVYGEATAVERTTCNYGLDPAHAHLARQHGLRVAATDETGEVRAVERGDHPFFVGTLYQPQLSSSPQRPHPIWTAFLDAVTLAR